jgi:GH24 family phage-related lysozyme (muramidase)
MRFARYVVAILLVVASMIPLEAKVRKVQPKVAAVPEISYCGPWPLTVSDQGVEFIKWLEGFHATPYRDSGGWAVGYGMHTWEQRKVSFRYPHRVTREEADAEFLVQLDKYQLIVRDSVCAAMKQSSYDALVSIAWNLGRVNTAIVVKALAGEPMSVHDFVVTATVRHRANTNLMARRIREFMMFQGDYATAMEAHMHTLHDTQAFLRQVRSQRISF